MKKWWCRWLQAVLTMLIVNLPPAGLAWDGHDVITEYALAGLTGLEQFTNIEITPYTYADVDPSLYNPEFELEYKLGALGDKVSALDILITYAPEPDWDLDERLELSSLQKLTGGSSGWRHQRYTLAGGLISLGEAPQRAQHFYDLALLAYDQADFYWAFRFLARSLHYLQDLSQPLHALPLPLSDLAFKYKFAIGRVESVASNVHYSIEEYFKYHLVAGDERLRQALHRSEAAVFTSVEKFATQENKRARQKVNGLYHRVLKIWPELDSAEEKRIPSTDFQRTEPAETLTELWELIEERLVATGVNTRGLVIKFLSEISPPDN